MEISEHLFRREWGRIVAVLTRVFGVHNLALAEDVVQDAFCRALEVWRIQGLPENPSAWLMTTAKRCALDVLRRERTALTFADELGRYIQSEWTLAPAVEEFFEPSAIKDDLLRMMFSCCHPRLREEAQVALVLHILCGFSVNETAGAFVASRSAIEKRLTRAKKVLAGSKRLFEVAIPADFSARLPAVQRTLYLLFSEGYHGASTETAVRIELCHEAMRLTALLREHPVGATPATYALAALMCLHAARLPSRTDESGNLSSLYDQDRSRWDQDLIRQGEQFLELSATGSDLSEYHVEAAIAWIHATAPSTDETDWAQIVSHYDTLMSLRPSPVVGLNRAIAIAEQQGAERGLEEIRRMAGSELLSEYPFYHATLGELELRSGRRAIARDHFARAIQCARNPMERNFLAQRMRISEGSRLSAGSDSELTCGEAG